MNCPNCSSENFVISFLWNAKGYSPIHPDDPCFKFERTLPWGKEYTSTCCGSHWLHLENHMYLIYPKQKKYFDEALQHSHHLSDEFKKTLDDIEYTFIEKGFDRSKMGSLHYPCAITLNTGRVIECATLILGGLNSTFFNLDPSEAYSGNIPYYFIDEISHLRPSRYALSSEVRRYSINTPERTFQGLTNHRGDVYICWYYVEFSQIPQEGDALFYPCELELKSSHPEDRPYNIPEALSKSFIFVHDPRYQRLV